MKFLKIALSSIMTMFFLVTFTMQPLAADTSNVKYPYIIGVVCSITGPNALCGIPERDTLLMLQEQINKQGGINGHSLNIIFEDDASDNTKAIIATKKLIEQDNVCAIIGSSGSNQTMALIPIIEASNVPLISLATGDEIIKPIKKWVFRTSQNDVTSTDKILDYLAVKKKINKVAMIYDSNDYGISGRDQLRSCVSKYKVQIVDEEVFSSRDTDMKVQLSKISSTSAQAIICWGTNPATMQVAKNVQQLGITLPLIMSSSSANQTFLDQAGIAANGILFSTGKLIVADSLPISDPQRKVLLEYKEQFKAKYNKTADAYGGYAWDALNILARALKRIGDDRSKLRDEIEKTTNFYCVSGIFKYSATNHSGVGQENFIMVQIKNGTWVLTK